ncbi:glycoside hydrolase family 88 protein [Lacticaseibacillus sp. GG6-2]
MSEFAAKERLQAIEKKYQTVASRTGSKIPYTTVDGHFDDHSHIGGDVMAVDHLSWWTNGFYPGILWELYAVSGSKQYSAAAKTIESELALNLTTMRGLDHDVGFMYLLSSGYDAVLTRSATAKQRALHAATILAGRFNLNGRFIRAWDARTDSDTRVGWSIIDTMMNLELLYWASATTGDPRFAAIANAHAHTVIKHAVRDDGSVKHIIVFDPVSGDYQHSLGGQGFAHGSAWTRGQSWGVSGFMKAYEYTGLPEYLATATKIADYCLQQLRPGAALPIDFDQPQTVDYVDNSATAILASGLLHLSTALQATQPEQAGKFKRAAIDLLEVIDAKYADYDDKRDNIVESAAVSYHDEPQPQPLIYADFYYIEALMRLGGYPLPLSQVAKEAVNNG